MNKLLYRNSVVRVPKSAGVSGKLTPRFQLHCFSHFVFVHVNFINTHCLDSIWTNGHGRMAILASPSFLLFFFTRKLSFERIPTRHQCGAVVFLSNTNFLCLPNRQAWAQALNMSS